MRRLIDPETNRKSVGYVYTGDKLSPTVATAEHSNIYGDIFRKFSDITVPNFNTAKPLHGVTHHIITKGPPCSPDRDVWPRIGSKQLRKSLINYFSWG